MISESLFEATLAAAQIHLGTILQDQGETGAIEAAAWFYRAAAQGEPEALFLMGEIHTNGTGVPQSDAVAVQWYELAAGQGHADAMYRLALALRNGRNLEQVPFGRRECQVLRSRLHRVLEKTENRQDQ